MDCPTHLNHKIKCPTNKNEFKVIKCSVFHHFVLRVELIKHFLGLVRAAVGQQHYHAVTLGASLPVRLVLQLRGEIINLTGSSTERRNY